MCERGSRSGATSGRRATQPLRWAGEIAAAGCSRVAAGRSGLQPLCTRTAHLHPHCHRRGERLVLALRSSCTRAAASQQPAYAPDLRSPCARNQLARGSLAPALRPLPLASRLGPRRDSSASRRGRLSLVDSTPSSQAGASSSSSSSLCSSEPVARSPADPGPLAASNGEVGDDDGPASRAIRAALQGWARLPVRPIILWLPSCASSGALDKVCGRDASSGAARESGSARTDGAASRTRQGRSR